MRSDEYYIEKTFELARRAEGSTAPNPLVGCIIVKNDRVVSWGFHRKAGLPHAEIEALNRAKERAKNATLFVNLEPCCHWGRTPPCVDRIISAGIKRVVIAAKDPNPQGKGASIKKLMQAGIKVKVGVLGKQAKNLNEVFFKNMKDKRPFVAAKIAQTLDGKIANVRGESQWITSQQARKYARNLRALYDAALVGINTVNKDNPRLTSKKKLVKIVLDANLKISSNARLFKEAKEVFIFAKKDIGRKRINVLKNKAKVIKLEYSSRGFDLNKVLKIIYSYGITSIFVEGGSFTLGRFFNTKLVDKVYVFVSPKIMGKSNALDSIGGEGNISINNLTRIDSINIERIGEDFLITGYPRFK